MRPSLVFSIACCLTGCVQLVAFEQPIVGQPDVIETAAPSGELVCDDDVVIGESALCDESCVIDFGAEGERCGGRVRADGQRLVADVSGLHEVELTLTVCGVTERPFVLVADGGGAVALERRGLAVGPSGGQPVYRNPAFLPDGDGCVDRTLLLQAGRMELAEAGHRLCGDALPGFARSWEMRVARDGARGLRTVEVCLRRAR